MSARYPHFSILAVVALGCVTTAATKPGERIAYKPEVVYSSFGEVDFDHDQQVVQTYLAALHPPEVHRDPCSQERTAREKLEGVAAKKRECPPEAPKAAPPPPPALAPVKILVDSIPEGVDIANGKIQVAEGKGFTLVGRVKWEIPQQFYLLEDRSELLQKGTANAVVRRRKSEIVEELKHLARAASANLVLITFLEERTDTAQGAVGLLFRVDLSSLDTSKNRQGKVPTEI